MTKPSNDGEIWVSYLTNVLGRKQYRGLEKTILQSAVEDSVNNGVMPSLSAMPAEIGRMNFSRRGLYKIMGAQEKTMPFYSASAKKIVELPMVNYPKENIIETLDKLSKKGGFLFPETQANFEKLIDKKHS